MKIIKNNIKTIVTGIIFTVVGVTLTTLALASTAIDLAPYENDYSEKVSNIRKIEAMLKTAKNELCVSERELANKKLEAYLNKDVELTKDDLVRLMNKSKWTCGEERVADVKKTIVNKQFYMWTKAEGYHWKIDALKLASKVSNNNLDFIRKITGENGNMRLDDQSRVIKNGVREPSFGFCQIHKRWHSEIVNDERFFTNPEWQMEQCFRLWKGGTKFYAKPRPKSEFYLKDY